MLCQQLGLVPQKADAVAMSVPFVPIRATLLDISFRAGANAAPRHVPLKKRLGQLNCPSHNLTKVGRLRYFPFSTASIITGNDNTAPYLYLFNPTDCSQIWAPSRKPFSCSHAEAGTGASWSGTLCFR